MGEESPTARLFQVCMFQLATEFWSPASAACRALPYATLLRPRRASWRALKNTPVTSAEMTTRAKMAAARAKPRSPRREATWPMLVAGIVPQIDAGGEGVGVLRRDPAGNVDRLGAEAAHGHAHLRDLRGRRGDRAGGIPVLEGDAV